MCALLLADESGLPLSQLEQRAASSLGHPLSQAGQQKLSQGQQISLQAVVVTSQHPLSPTTGFYYSDAPSSTCVRSGYDQSSNLFSYFHYLAMTYLS
ncbi:unnamed protein product [Protopolystoma xenopodis]|uniref:Uncharacterized protein n=1 Tax=Protopolystoma xenopodis TaxID=117903 RepID=A0A448XIJ8_9PLAT|nr:unnamed protein product [Protopolystoma xenopodis]